MNTYYQVTFRENGNLHVLENHITNYQDANELMEDFAVSGEYIDNEYTDLQIYQINYVSSLV